jgi:hypothetical protein
MAVNARGTMLCYKYAGKQMISQGHGGRIIGTFSIIPLLLVLTSIAGACSLAGKQGHFFPLHSPVMTLTLHEQPWISLFRIVRASLQFAVSHKLLVHPLPK